MTLLASALLLALLLCSCTRKLGYGVLLWAAEDPPVPSGTVLPVYIRSNIDQVWVAGIPEEYRQKESKIDKFEIPLAKLELAGSKSKALQMAEAFAPYALTYAETLQDGLPIRESPDNSARRVYRLKPGEILKILSPARGVVAVGTTGDPLPGEWFQVLTEDGSTGYCFSYRLKLFEHTGGVLVSAPREQQAAEDPDLEFLFSRTWSVDSYRTMVNNRRINLEELSEHWGFDPGQDTGIARIRIKDLDRTFSYTRIRSTGTRSWRFEDSVLQMDLRSDTTLAVQFTENGGVLRTLFFVALPTDVDDFIVQETARREELFGTIYAQGPAYTSHNYGTISFTEEGRFSWTGYELLVPHVIPASALGTGTVSMRLFLSNALADRYAGALTLNFSGVNGPAANVNFMYALDSQGFRLEYIPDTSMDGIVVSRRASSPLVLYLFKAEPLLPLTPDFFGFPEAQEGAPDEAPQGEAEYGDPGMSDMVDEDPEPPPPPPGEEAWEEEF
jgi:hypothetical protein